MIPSVIAAALAILCPTSVVPFDASVCAQVPTVDAWSLVDPASMPNTAGQFLPDSRTVVIAGLSTPDSRIGQPALIAPMVAHELIHARQYATSTHPDYAHNCTAMETEAYKEQGRVWSWLWYNNPPHLTYGALEETNTQAAMDPLNPAFATCFMRGLIHA